MISIHDINNIEYANLYSYAEEDTFQMKFLRFNYHLKNIFFPNNWPRVYWVYFIDCIVSHVIYYPIMGVTLLMILKYFMFNRHYRYFSTAYFLETLLTPLSLFALIVFAFLDLKSMNTFFGILDAHRFNTDMKGGVWFNDVPGDSFKRKLKDFMFRLRVFRITSNRNLKIFLKNLREKPKKTSRPWWEEEYILEAIFLSIITLCGGYELISYVLANPPTGLWETFIFKSTRGMPSLQVVSRVTGEFCLLYVPFLYQEGTAALFDPDHYIVIYFYPIYVVFLFEIYIGAGTTIAWWWFLFFLNNKKVGGSDDDPTSKKG